MKTFRKSLFAATALTLCLTGTAFAQNLQGGTTQPEARPNGSLFGKNNRTLFEDIKASRVGDTITILVQESASASSSANTKTSKSDSAAFNGGTGLLGGLLKSFGASANTSSDGQGQTNRSGSLVTRLTVVVKEVLPNGNLMVEGSRIVGVNAEKQKVVISGILRPQDVATDNTASSVSLANATVQYDGKGTVGAHQRRGLITSLFSWIF